MSLIYGEIRQLGYVVHDIEAAMRHWIDVLGVGPWFYVDRLPVKNFLYRGKTSDVHMRHQSRAPEQRFGILNTVVPPVVGFPTQIEARPGETPKGNLLSVHRGD